MRTIVYLLFAVLFVSAVYSASTDDDDKTDVKIPELKKAVITDGIVENLVKTKEQEKEAEKTETKDKTSSDDVADDPASYGNYRTQPRMRGLMPQDDNRFDQSRYGRPRFNDELMSRRPACHSLFDPQYPVISEVCGTVPYSRYTLPNSLGHRDRWHVAKVLTTLMEGVTDATCARALPLLLCPVLFPTCPTRREAPLVLPCQSYCRAMKSRCGSAALEHLPCEVFPHTSKFCPTHKQQQQHYGSQMSQSAHDLTSQPLPMSSELPSLNYPPSQSLPVIQSALTKEEFQEAVASSPAVFNLQTTLAAAKAQNNAPQTNDDYNPRMAGPPSRTYSNDDYNPRMAGPPSRTYGDDDYNPRMAGPPSRTYSNDYRQSSRYGPMLRAGNEMRSTSEMRRPPNMRPSFNGFSSMNPRTALEVPSPMNIRPTLDVLSTTNTRSAINPLSTNAVAPAISALPTSVAGPAISSLPVTNVVAPVDIRLTGALPAAQAPASTVPRSSVVKA